MSFLSNNVDEPSGTKVNGVNSLDECRSGILGTSDGDTSAHATPAQQTTDDLADTSPSFNDEYNPRISTDWEDALLNSDSIVEETSGSANDHPDTAADSRGCDELDDEDEKDGCRFPCSVSSWFFCSLNRREKLVILSVAVVNMTSQMCLSIMAPFFPIEVN